MLKGVPMLKINEGGQNKKGNGTWDRFYITVNK